MGRKRRLCCGILTAVIITVLCLLGVSGCIDGTGDVNAPTDIILFTDNVSTRAADPGPDRITDANIFVFSSDGFLERSEYIKGKECPLPLVYGRDYDIFACVNFGYRLGVRTLEELHALDFHLAYPDEYATGMPMCGEVHGVRAGKPIRLPLTRMMAEIRLSMDRNRLDDGVNMTVRNLRIGNCPKKCRVFSESRMEKAEDCFTVGFSRSSEECRILNSALDGGKSSELSLYMLENVQGSFPGGAETDADKVIDRKERLADVCSYIEMELDYSSRYHYSSDGFLKYRFYLGESRNDLSVMRNCRYHITVTPEGDGLKDEGWRVDKTNLSDVVNFIMRPDGLIETVIGDEIHVRCDFSPAGAPFKIGLEELEKGRERGVFEYSIDDDWHGVKIRTTGCGMGSVYMEAGEPVNQAGLLNISVSDRRK